MSTAKPRWRSIVSITSWLTGLSSATSTCPRARRPRRRGATAGSTPPASPRHLRERLEQRGAADRLRQGPRHVRRVAGRARPTSASPAGRRRAAARRGSRARRRRRSSPASRESSTTRSYGRPRCAAALSMLERRRPVRGVVADRHAAAQIARGRSRGSWRCRRRPARAVQAGARRARAGSGARRRPPRTGARTRNVLPRPGCDSAVSSPPMIDDQPARDREAQPRAAEPPRGRGVGLRERLEQLRELLRRDADARVAHLHAQAARGRRPAGSASTPHRHLARGR